MTYPVEERVRIANAVITGLRNGIPLTVICSGDGMPCDDTIRLWAQENETLSREIARAREAGWDAIAYRLRETARGKGDSTEDVQRDKLIIETDLKLLAKWDPKRYGDLIKHGNADGTNLDVGDMLAQRRQQVADGKQA